MSSGASAIEVRELSKTFRIPSEQVHTIKERALHPFRRQRFHERRVLDGIDFEILTGEFFGIVGRNGSGKSTLLKCMAGIYRADHGTISVAGRLSPFIELGVGFNPDLTARDNVVLNAVMMGLSPGEARARFDDIIAFAGLEEFIDLKLKNYSSGMQVRLAFSVMAQSDADVFLIDEVLAVGDAAFQQKCFDVFHRLRQEGKTIVLVTHAMELCARFCHRAMLLSNGRIATIGDPDAVARGYLAENFVSHQNERFGDRAGPAIRLIDLHLEDADGARVDVIPHGERMRLRAVFEAAEDIDAPGIVLWIDNDEYTRVVSFGAREQEQALADLRAGEQIDLAVELDNWLPSGRHHVGVSVSRGPGGADVLLYLERAIDFHVWGGEAIRGIVTVPHQWSVARDPNAAVPS